MNIILIDISYYIFYRYYALHSWWKLAKPDEELVVPFENEEFVLIENGLQEGDKVILTPVLEEI